MWLYHPDRVIHNTCSSLITKLIKNTNFLLEVRSCCNVWNWLIVISDEGVASSWERNDWSLVSFKRFSIKVAILSLEHPSMWSVFSNQRQVFTQKYILVGFKIDYLSRSCSKFILIIKGVSSIILSDAFTIPCIVVIILIYRVPVHLCIHVGLVKSVDI